MSDVIYIFFFFFSSRRRHTRSTRDWSSDVCSSDLKKRSWGALPTTGKCCRIAAGGFAVVSAFPFFDRFPGTPDTNAGHSARRRTARTETVRSRHREALPFSGGDKSNSIHPRSKPWRLQCPRAVFETRRETPAYERGSRTSGNEPSRAYRGRIEAKRPYSGGNEAWRFKSPFDAGVLGACEAACRSGANHTSIADAVVQRTFLFIESSHDIANGKSHSAQQLGKVTAQSAAESD